jgi:hypothetical protein
MPLFGRNLTGNWLEFGANGRDATPLEAMGLIFVVVTALT